MSHRTYRTRIQVDEPQNVALSAYAQLVGSVSRTLHTRIELHTQQTGEVVTSGSFKNDALKEFGLTGRQFNAIAIGVEGRRSSTVECRALHIEEARDRIVRLKATITELKESLTKGRLEKGGTKRKPLTAKQRIKVLYTIHQKSRSLGIRERTLDAMLAQEKAGAVSMCFGSRHLFRKQFHLQENGYASHEAWKADWERSRNNQFMVLGSKGETSGCQGCVATVAQDGSIDVRVRLPDSLNEIGTYTEIKGLRFAYGHAQIVQALRANEARKVIEAQVRKTAKTNKSKFSETDVPGGVALTWRFLRDERTPTKGWEVLVSIDAFEQKQVSIKSAGRVGLDLNVDHFAVAETDYFGNYVKTFSIPCATQGLSSDQATAVIGDAVKELIAYAASVKKPVTLEKLDFKAKKRGLKAQNPKYAKMLSSFAYGKTKQLIEARAFDAGLEVFLVNPAYTSVIGRVKYAIPLGITSHEAAALAIARRSQGVRERAPQPGRTCVIPVKGGTTAWTAPDWMRPQHRAYPWRRIAQSLPRPLKRESVRNSAAGVSAKGQKPEATSAGAAGNPLA